MMSFARRRADEPGEPLGAATAGDDPEQDLGLAELRPLGHDPDVAGQRDLAAAAERVSRHCRDDHPGNRCNRVERRDEQTADDRRLVRATELGDVRTRGEHPVPARDDDRARRVRVQILGHGLQLREQRGGQRVDLGVVEGDDGDAVGTPLDADQCGIVGHAAGQ